MPVFTYFMLNSLYSFIDSIISEKLFLNFFKNIGFESYFCERIQVRLV